MIPPSDHDQGQLPADNRKALRQVARSARKGVLSTLMGGAPYASLVTLSFDHDLSPILLLSGLADHTRNLVQDSRCAVLLDGTDGLDNPQTGPRVTLMGAAHAVEDPRLKARFLARHPGAARYAGFGDFSIYRIAVERAHFVGGFARAVWFDAPFGLPDCGWLIRAEADLLAQARQVCRGVIGVDPDGLDGTDGQSFWRRNFHQTIKNQADFVAAISNLPTNPGV